MVAGVADERAITTELNAVGPTDRVALRIAPAVVAFGAEVRLSSEAEGEMTTESTPSSDSVQPERSKLSELVLYSSNHSP